MSDIFLSIEDPNTSSYSRLYVFWKKRVSIARLVATELRRKKMPLAILDTGCGNGENIFYLNSLYNESSNHSFTGIDLSESNIKSCNNFKNKKEISNVSFRIGNIEKLDFEDDSFDIVINSEVLEHLKDPLIAIKEMKRVLKKQGILIITTPNKSNYFLKVATIFRFFGLWKKKKNITLDPNEPVFGAGFGHISVKSLSEWISIFQCQAFKVEVVTRGAPLFGNVHYDDLRGLFFLSLGIDMLFDHLPFVNNFTETIIMKLRKRK